MITIGIDPHKASHTAVALEAGGATLAELRVVADASMLGALQRWAAGWPQRVWAIEGASGLGRLLAQQLVAAGESVLDVPAALAARARVLARGHGRKTDGIDARSVALVAQQHGDLLAVAAVTTAACFGCSQIAATNSPGNGDPRSTACTGGCVICTPAAPPADPKSDLNDPHDRPDRPIRLGRTGGGAAAMRTPGRETVEGCRCPVAACRVLARQCFEVRDAASVSAPDRATCRQAVVGGA